MIAPRRCIAPIDGDTLCGREATTTRTVDGLDCALCSTHATEIDHDTQETTMLTTHTITTAKGTHTGTLAEVCRWQAEYQGAYADIDGVDVSGIEMDLDDVDAAVAAVRAAIDAEVST